GGNSMKRVGSIGLVSLSGLVLGGCEGASVDGEDGLSALLALSDEGAGDNCENGGTKGDYGPDLDGDGGMTSDEIQGAETECNGQAGGGVSGRTGSDGSKADQGPKGATGASRADCQSGETGAQGEKGETGEKGDTAATGDTGATGGIGVT